MTILWNLSHLQNRKMGGYDGRFDILRISVETNCHGSVESTDESLSLSLSLSLLSKNVFVGGMVHIRSKKGRDTPISRDVT